MKSGLDTNVVDVNGFMVHIILKYHINNEIYI